ncbi:hypothetical protein [Nocardia grenadensis]|uniref:hypothetical protein n=1 Tax=Nocardia grenadensis TaxID=931537 RepID=UPI003D73D455
MRAEVFMVRIGPSLCFGEFDHPTEGVVPIRIVGPTGCAPQLVDGDPSVFGSTKATEPTERKLEVGFGCRSVHLDVQSVQVVDFDEGRPLFFGEQLNDHRLASR